MSKTVLIAAVAGCFLVVGGFAALTATVIVDGGGTRVVRLQSAPVPGPGQVPGPGRGFRQLVPGKGFQQLPKLKACLEQHGVGPSRETMPDLQQMRKAMQDCLPSATGIR